MGIESFRMRIDWLANVDEDVVFSRLSGEFRVEPHYYYEKRFLLFSKKVFTSEYRIEDFIIASCYAPSKSIEIEACFSNYTKYAQLIYGIYEWAC